MPLSAGTDVVCYEWTSLHKSRFNAIYSHSHNLIRDAAEAAGIKIIRMIHEHIAGLLAYGVAHEHRGNPGLYVVVDVGGTQVSLRRKEE